MSYDLIKQENLYKDSRLTLLKDTVLNPYKEEQIFTYIKKRDAVLVVAEIKGTIILIQQSRYLCGHKYYELPGGAINTGESPEKAAIRELEEETGYKNPDVVHCLGSFHPLLSITTEVNHVYYLKGLKKGATNHDSTEFDLIHKRFSVPELPKIIDNSMISAPDMLALCKYLNFKNNIDNLS